MLNSLLPASQTTRDRITEFVFNVCINKISTHECRRERYRKRLENYLRQAKTDKLTVPVVYSQVKASQAVLDNIFVTRTPLFQVVAGKEYVQEAQVMTALIERDANFYKWRKHFTALFLDVLLYNICAAEVEWKETKRFVYSPENSIRKLVDTSYVGNSIKRISPYNLFYDSRVPVSAQHSDGDFIAYVEQFTHTQFEKFWQANKEFLYTDSKKEVYDNVVNSNLYYEPEIKQTLEPSKLNLWDTFLDPDSKKKNLHRLENTVEFVTCYFRAVPNMLDLVVPDRARVKNFKALFANKKLIHLELLEANYDYFPLVVSTGIDDALDEEANSFAESIEDIQDLASSLWNAELEATKRVIADRFVYNPTLINPEHANNLKVSRIPLRRTTYNTNPKDAFAQIPFTDQALGLRLQQAREIFNFAYTITGQNPVAQGQFVKGNKTNDQFRESMAASQSRIIAIAVALSNQFFDPIKSIILDNLIANVTVEEVFDKESQQTLQANPEKLRNIAFSFELADGLFEAQKLVGLDSFMTFFSMLMSLPEVRMEYDIPGMLEYIGTVSGARHLKDYKLTPEEQQAMLQKLMAMQVATSGGEAIGAAIPQQSQQPQ